MPAPPESPNHTPAAMLPLLRSPAAFSPSDFSRSPLVAQLLDLFPVERRPPWVLPSQLSSALAQRLERCMHLILIGNYGVWDQSGDSPAMPCDHDLLAPLHPIEQASERILGFEGANLPQRRNGALFHLS